MTNQEKVQRLTIMLGYNESNDILNTYLSIAEDIVLNRIYPFAIPTIEIYNLTSDTEIDNTKSYYTRSVVNNYFVYSLVENPILDDISTYYEKTIMNCPIPLKYEHIQLQVAVYLISKRGAEGETQHSENGVARIYTSADVPDYMFNEIVPKAGIIQ